jgi:excisionase family DNA binding protein
MQLESGRGLATAQDVAGYLGISPKTVYEYAQRGFLPCVRIGDRIVRFDWEDIEQFVIDARGGKS